MKWQFHDCKQDVFLSFDILINGDIGDQYCNIHMKGECLAVEQHGKPASNL